ncbi:unnamed protein product, partial [Prorocentrum cordatum]
TTRRRTRRSRRKSEAGGAVGHRRCRRSSLAGRWAGGPSPRARELARHPPGSGERLGGLCSGRVKGKLYMCWACCGSVCRLAVVGCCHGDRWHSEQARLREHHGRCRGRRGGSSGGACPKQARGRVGQAEHRACRVRVRLLRAAVDAMAAEEEQARQEERRSRG